MARSSLPVRSSFSAFFSTSARFVATGRWDLDPIKQGRRPERAAVHLRVAMPGHGVEMIARGVALMAVEPVARIVCMELEHRPVARDLRHDRGRGDRGAP